MKISGIKHKVKRLRTDLRHESDVLEHMAYKGFCEPIARNLDYLETQGWAVWEKVLDAAHQIDSEHGKETGLVLKGTIVGFLIARGKL